MKTITLKAIANSGTDEDGNPITILQIEGDPLNIDSSGSWDLEMDVMIPTSAIPESQQSEDLMHMISDEGVAERKRIYALKHNIKWDHLHCMDTNGLCLGPVCEQWLGLEYVDCPKAKVKI